MSADIALDIAVLAPVLALLVGALAVLAADWIRPDGSGRVSAGLGLLACAAAGFLALTVWPHGGAVAFGEPVAAGGVETGLLRLDGLASYLTWTVIVATALAIAVSVGYTARRHIAHAEHFALLLVAAAGMAALSMAADLIVLFLLLETFSLALYVLAGLARGDRAGLEAAVKYFVLGAVGAAFLLYGAASVYGATGTTNLDAVAAAIEASEGATPLLLAGLGLLLVGLGFKAGVVPFHQWVPDVYEGAPTPVSGFMSAATKAAAFAALARVLWTAFGPIADAWLAAVAVIAVLTMVVGNLGALVQSDLKRMLGYSSVAQAGYVLAALLAGTAAGTSAALYYLLVLALMSLGAFAVIAAIGPVGGSGRDASNLEDLRGLAGRHPGLALAMAVFLVSLIGLPPTAGFIGKWFIFQALIEAELAPLAVAVVLNSVLSAFYYARPILYMYAAPADRTERLELGTPAAVAIGTTALVVALAALLSGPLLSGAAAAGDLRGVEAADGSGAAGSEQLFFTAPRFEKGATREP